MSKQLERARSYWSSEKARDLDQILEHFAEDAVFRAPTMRLNGRGEIKQYYENVLNNFKSIDVSVLNSVESGRSLVVEWRCRLLGHDDLLREVLGCNVFEFEGDQFQTLRVYFNPADFD